MNILDRLDPTPNRLRDVPRAPWRKRHPGVLMVAAGALVIAALCGTVYVRGEAKDDRNVELAQHFAAKYDVDVIGFKIETVNHGGRMVGKAYVSDTEEVIVWSVDGQERDCAVAGEDTDDPSLICEGTELLRAGARP